MLHFWWLWFFQFEYFWSEISGYLPLWAPLSFRITDNIDSHKWAVYYQIQELVAWEIQISVELTWSDQITLLDICLNDLKIFSNYEERVYDWIGSNENSVVVTHITGFGLSLWQEAGQAVASSQSAERKDVHISSWPFGTKKCMVNQWSTSAQDPGNKLLPDR